MSNAKPVPKLLLSLPIALCIALVGMYFYGLSFDVNKSSSRLIGKRLPSFSLPALQEQGLVLHSTNIKGPALINVWASWCGPCREEHPLLLRIVRDHGIAVYGVDYQDDAETAKLWLSQNANPFTWVMFDGAAASGPALDIFSLPQTYAIDINGVVRARHIGALTPAIWQTLYESIMISRQ